MISEKFLLFFFSSDIESVRDKKFRVDCFRYSFSFPHLSTPYGVGGFLGEFHIDKYNDVGVA